MKFSLSLGFVFTLTFTLIFGCARVSKKCKTDADCDSTSYCPSAEACTVLPKFEVVAPQESFMSQGAVEVKVLAPFATVARVNVVATHGETKQQLKAQMSQMIGTQDTWVGQLALEGLSGGWSIDFTSSIQKHHVVRRVTIALPDVVNLTPIEISDFKIEAVARGYSTSQDAKLVYAEPSQALGGEIFRRNDAAKMRVSWSLPTIKKETVKLKIAGIPETSTFDPSRIAGACCDDENFCACFDVPMWKVEMEAFRGKFGLTASAVRVDKANVKSPTRSIMVTRVNWSREISGYNFKLRRNTIYLASGDDFARIDTDGALSMVGVKLPHGVSAFSVGKQFIFATTSKSDPIYPYGPPQFTSHYEFNIIPLDGSPLVSSDYSVQGGSGRAAPPAIVNSGGQESAFQIIFDTGAVWMSPSSPTDKFRWALSGNYGGGEFLMDTKPYVIATDQRLMLAFGANDTNTVRSFKLKHGEEIDQPIPITFAPEVWPTAFAGYRRNGAFEIAVLSKINSGEASTVSFVPFSTNTIERQTNFQKAEIATPAVDRDGTLIFASKDGALCRVQPEGSTRCDAFSLDGHGAEVMHDSRVLLATGQQYFVSFSDTSLALFRESSFSKSHRAEWYFKPDTGDRMATIAPEFTMGCQMRRSAQGENLGSAGVLYFRASETDSSGQSKAVLYSIATDSLGIDSTAMWPMKYHDPAQTNNLDTALAEFACEAQKN